MAVKHVTLRAWSDNSDVPPVKINQGDILSRTIIMTLLDSTGAPIDLTLSSARVHFSKPDGTVVYLTASIVNAAAGIISVTLDSQCTAVPGLVKSIVQVTGPDGENMYCTGPKISVGAINVENSVASSNEFTALTEALAQVQNIANKADLNADGKVIQDPASYGKAGGAATLNSNGKVIQDPASSTVIRVPLVLNNTTGDWTGSASGGMAYVKIGGLVKFKGWFYVSDVGNGGNMMFTLPIKPDDYYQFAAYKTKPGADNSTIPASQFILANPFKNDICMGFTSSGSNYQIATGLYFCDGSYFTYQ
jgi:hypothetical protein